MLQEHGAGKAFAVAIGLSAALHVLTFGVVSVRGMGAREAVVAEVVPFELEAEQVTEQPKQPDLQRPPQPEQAQESRAHQPERSSSSSPPSSVASVRPTRQAKATAASGSAGSRKGSASTAGSGGGGLGMGSFSSSGTFAMAGGGDTPLGWVPGEGSGRGAGSGAGRGPRTPEAVQPQAPHAPQPPPAPSYVQLVVCSASGEIAGRHCSASAKKSFVEGRQPVRTCTVCKAPVPRPEPAPAHKSVEAEVTAARKLSGTAPSCPVRLRSDVSVTCEFQIGTGGSVSDVSVVDTSGIPAVDRAAVDALKGWKYVPATQNGAPRSVRKRVTFAFKS